MEAGVGRGPQAPDACLGQLQRPCDLELQLALHLVGKFFVGAWDELGKEQARTLVGQLLCAHPGTSLACTSGDPQGSLHTLPWSWRGKPLRSSLLPAVIVQLLGLQVGLVPFLM